MTDEAVEAPPANPIEEQDPMEAPPPQPAEEEGKSPEEERPGRPGSGGAAPNRAAPDPDDRQPPSTT
ncbi:MAG: hypothetical protein QOD37_2487 [Gaiellales bacterium]|jgi:hypothetical protein|nr:hypothetical protein [Gaiellales bacterium]MDX6571548.1 hypothetical protein [Gaiellales bacterium]